MGHYYSERHHPGEETFHQRYADYQKACAKEISDIIEKNPIKLEDTNVGDKLKLYSPLHGMSKVRFENKGESHKIRELFAPTAHYYSMNMWPLASVNFFTVWGKMTESICGKEKNHFIRISKPNLFDWNPGWIDIRYFSHTNV